MIVLPKKPMRHSVPWGLCCILAVLACAIPGRCGTGGPPLPYTRTLWRTSEGLPEATVQALTETRDGRLWIGTTGGLADFDGQHLRTLNAEKLQSLGVNSIFCLERDSDGTLWAGTEGGGLLHVGGGAVQAFSARQGLSDGFVRAILEDARHTLWVGTDNGLFRREGDRFRRVDDGVHMPRIAVHALAEDHDGNLWVGGSQLLSLAQDGGVRLYRLAGTYSKNRVKSILQTSDGTVWVGTVGGLQRRVGERFVPVPAIKGTVRSLLETADGHLWIGTIGDGLWTAQGGASPRPLNTPGLLPSDTVLSLLQDSSGQIWIGTQAGMLRLHRTPVGIVALPHGGDPDFETISGDAEGHVWVAAQKLWAVRNRTGTELHLPQLEGVSIRNVFRAHDGALWVGTDGSGAYRLEGNSLRHLSAPRELPNNFIRGFLETHDAALWIATDEGVSRITRTATQILGESAGLAYRSTRCLLEDHTGAVWVGTDHGVSVWAHGRFEKTPVTALLAQEKVWSILEDRQQTLWFATRDHGLFRWRHGRLQQFTTAQGLPSNSLYDLLQDAHGTFWLTGPDKIGAVGEAGMEADEPAAGVPLSVTLFGMPFGADGAQLYGGRQPSGFLGHDFVWFPTSRGAAYVQTTLPPHPGASPRAVISSVEGDGRVMPLSTGLRVPAAVTRISLGVGAVFLEPQDGLRLRYRLEPLEHDWNTVTGGVTATYTNLAANRYRFVVEAFDEADPRRTSEAAFAFTKEPFFYETWWFYLLVLLTIVGIAALVYWLRLRQVRKRFEAVLAERSRLARELHDTVIQGCTGISALLEAMASRDDGALDSDLLLCARNQARSTIDDARQAVWDMRHEESAVDLLEALRLLAAQTTREHERLVHLETDLPALTLGTSAAHEVIMTLREAIYNSVQHSGSERIEVHLWAAGDELRIRVVDFGIGFEPARAAFPDGHFGILGMGERMKRLGGRLDLRSTPGAGTTVTLRLRYNRRFVGPLSSPNRV